MYALNLPESLIRNAIANTKSAKQAARYLNVTYGTFKKYAKMYIDEESGKTLFELAKNMGGKGITRIYHLDNPNQWLDEWMAGDRPGADLSRVQELLLTHAVIPSVCANCDFSECRITDGKYPFQIDFKDGNYANKSKENLQFLCYNCYYLMVGNIMASKLSKYDWMEPEKDIYLVNDKPSSHRKRED